jgi:hypothetical protein
MLSHLPRDVNILNLLIQKNEKVPFLQNPKNKKSLTIKISLLLVQFGFGDVESI